MKVKSFAEGVAVVVFAFIVFACVALLIETVKNPSIWANL